MSLTRPAYTNYDILKSCLLLPVFTVCVNAFDQVLDSGNVKTVQIVELHKSGENRSKSFRIERAITLHLSRLKSKNCRWSTRRRNCFIFSAVNL